MRVIKIACVVAFLAVLASSVSMASSPVPQVLQGGFDIKMMKCLYSDGHCSACFNDARGDWMCGAWLGGSGIKIPCDAPCVAPQPRENIPPLVVCDTRLGSEGPEDVAGAALKTGSTPSEEGWLDYRVVCTKYTNGRSWVKVFMGTVPLESPTASEETSNGDTDFCAPCELPTQPAQPARGGFYITGQVPSCWFEVGSYDRKDVWLHVQADPSGTVNVDSLAVGTYYVWRIPDGTAAKVEVLPGTRQEVFLR